MNRGKKEPKFMYDMQHPTPRQPDKWPVNKITESFWHDFYARGRLQPQAASPFAVFCLENCFSEKTRILEFGCGNGRDSFSFLHYKIPVLGVDGCEVAICANNDKYQRGKALAPGRFVALDFAKIETLPVRSMTGINTVYSRFVLHAIPEHLETRLLDFSWEILPPGGRMFHEFRTTRDPLMKKGEVIGPFERLTDHYRRFVNTETFREKLMAKGWKELFFKEGFGLAVLGDDDPFVARIVVEKPKEHTCQ